MAWQQWNPNPQGLLVGDCTIRAISAATGRSWNNVHRQLCDLAREMADMPSADRVWWELLRRDGFGRQTLINQCPECYTLADFAAAHKTGVYVLGSKEHATALLEGDWWDTWDSGQTIPTYFFRRLYK